MLGRPSFFVKSRANLENRVRRFVDGETDIYMLRRRKSKKTRGLGKTRIKEGEEPRTGNSGTAHHINAYVGRDRRHRGHR